MDAASSSTSHSGSFSVLQAAKEGFRAANKNPLPLLGMAIAVNLPGLLYTLFIRIVFQQGESLWAPGISGFPFLASIPKAENVLAVILMLIAMLMLRPIWIRACLTACSVASPRPNSQTYRNFAAASIIEILAVVLISSITRLFMNMTKDFVQAGIGAVGLLLIASLIVYFAFFPYLIVHLGYGAVQSLKESVKFVQGIFWPLFKWGAVLVFFVMILNMVPFIGAAINDLLFGTAVAMIYIRRRELLTQ
jgi:hypothetical protein